jgi:putative DNA methylase
VKTEGKNKRIGKQLMGIIAEGNKGRLFVASTPEQELASSVIRPDDYPEGTLSTNPRWFSPPAFGMTEFCDLFTERQLTLLTTLSDLINDAKNEAIKDAVAAGMDNDHIPLREGGKGATAYGEAIAVYLSFAVDRQANYSSTLNGWGGDFIIQTFGRQALPMVWDFAETNPFSDSTGNWSGAINWIALALEKFPAVGNAEVEQFDARRDSGLRNVIVSTDPPYYDNIGYADLSDYFYVWMRRSLKSVYPGIFNTILVPKADELVAIPFRFEGDTQKAKEFFEDGMYFACKQLRENSSDEYPITIYYAFKQSETKQTDNGSQTASSGWETMLSAIVNAGLTITGTWPMHTERETGFKASVNALASSIVLVCRKRSQNASVCTRRNFVNELKRELKSALKKLQESNIAPVDLAQSAIGPGMGVFSKYSQVLEADGKAMSVRSALHIINQELDLYFNEQDSDLDSESRFCVDLYSQFAFNEMPFGDANTLATAKNTSVAIMASHGTLYAQKGKVHLIERSELPERIDEHEGSIWLLCQQLTYKMEKEGVEGCAKAIYNMFGSNAERAKDLAYRLYTIAERKRWAQEAYAYNALVVAWPEIQSRAAELKAIKPEQMTIMDFLQ